MEFPVYKKVSADTVADKACALKRRSPDKAGLRNFDVSKHVSKRTERLSRLSHRSHVDSMLVQCTGNLERHVAVY